MRALGFKASGRKTITATPRQLESLIRLSEAHARLHLRADVLAEDVAEAIRLMDVSTQRAATDPTTGLVDMDLIATGRGEEGQGLMMGGGGGGDDDGERGGGGGGGGSDDEGDQ